MKHIINIGMNHETAPVELRECLATEPDNATRALKALKQARREKLIRIQDAAVLRKDEKGKVHIRETADMGGGKGAALGGVAGAAIGLLAGPALLVPAAVGALVGGLSAKLRDSGFSNERLQTLGESLKQARPLSWRSSSIRGWPRWRKPWPRPAPTP